MGPDFSKIDVPGTSTKSSGWERIGVRNVFKSLKGFDDRSLAAEHNLKKVILNLGYGWGYVSLHPSGRGEGQDTVLRLPP